MTQGIRRPGWKCPACGDLDGSHIAGCRFSPPFDTDEDIRRYYDAQRIAIAGHSDQVTEVVQRVAGEPSRRASAPDYVVVVQVISLHARPGQKPELIEESEMAEVDRYPRLTDALKHAERIAPMIRLKGACDRCSGSGELDNYGTIITCPDCKGEGRTA